MSNSRLDRHRVGALLRECALRKLFVSELGWDYGGEDIALQVDGKEFALEAIAHKGGFVAYQCLSAADGLPDRVTCRKIERDLDRIVHEHLIVYISADLNTQYWQWVKREPGTQDRQRMHVYRSDHSGTSLIQKLERIVFTLQDEEEGVTISETASRVRAAFDVNKVTKRFYERFRSEHMVFLGFVTGIREVADTEWYASLMLNRMMFVYFIQKQGFLDGNPDYLVDRLRKVKNKSCGDSIHTFYQFLLRLFHDGLGRPEAMRSSDMTGLLGRVPHLNGGLFDIHELERENPDIHIADEAFERIFTFFEEYQWHLDDRLLRSDDEINPDVLGYIFEKYINQKQMGAYYTKEDITGYITRNTIIPFLFDRVKVACSDAFEPNGPVWRLLKEEPERYFHKAASHGTNLKLPSEIAAGLDDVSQREIWNRQAPLKYALNRETWREHIARRHRYEETRTRLNVGEVTSIDDLITYNLDIETFAYDVITRSEEPRLVYEFWNALRSISILDPTCGSGAFLFAALNILEPLYEACLETMAAFVNALETSSHVSEDMSKFRSVLKETEKHANESYFILKSIMVNNLYGVDIMEEAVEICKLRLYLKLVSQLDSYEQIEPLPDIDFNIRTGNTLVGFTSRKELRKAVEADMLKRMSLPEIEELASEADHLYHKFCRKQTHDADADTVALLEIKKELQKALRKLSCRLDKYLADDSGVKVADASRFSSWRKSHMPFHWFTEFFGKMQHGGFDIVVGNPPYVEVGKVLNQYSPREFKTRNVGNLYGLCVEGFLDVLSPAGRYGVIVPISAISTPRMLPLMRLLTDPGGGGGNCM